MGCWEDPSAALSRRQRLRLWWFWSPPVERVRRLADIFAGQTASPSSQQPELKEHAAGPLR